MQINKSLEQFLTWYLPILIISRLTKGVMTPFIATSYANDQDFSLAYVFLTYAVVVTSALEHAVGAVWVFKNAILSQRAILWGLFALFTGIWGVMLFLAVLIYEDLRTPRGSEEERL